MDRNLLVAVPGGDPRMWFRLVLTLAAPKLAETSKCADLVQSKVQVMDDATLASVRGVFDGKLQFAALSDEALDVYFDLAVVVAGSQLADCRVSQ